LCQLNLFSVIPICFGNIAVKVYLNNAQSNLHGHTNEYVENVNLVGFILVYRAKVLTSRINVYAPASCAPYL